MSRSQAHDPSPAGTSSAEVSGRVPRDGSMSPCPQAHDPSPPTTRPAHWCGVGEGRGTSPQPTQAPTQPTGRDPQSRTAEGRRAAAERSESLTAGAGRIPRAGPPPQPRASGSNPTTPRTAPKIASTWSGARRHAVAAGVGAVLDGQRGAVEAVVVPIVIVPWQTPPQSSLRRQVQLAGHPAREPGRLVSVSTPLSGWWKLRILVGPDSRRKRHRRPCLGSDLRPGPDS